MAFATFQFRRDTSTAWTSANPILLSGELGLETDTNLFKIGNGTAAWNTLPYGGIKGDTGAKGDLGNTGATGNKGWSPVLAVVTDGERRVLQVTDWVGGEGTKPATGSFIGAAGFVATAAQGVDIRGATGAAGSNGVTSFNGRTGAISPQQADYDAFFTTPAEASASAPVQSVSGTAGQIAVNASTGAVAVSLTNTGVTAGSYTSANITVDAQGRVTVASNGASAPTKLSAKISTLFASTANSTAVQVVLSLAIPAGYLTAGKTFDFDLEGTQSQSAAATNVVGAIFVNNTQLVSAAVAGGTAAQTNRSIRMKGGIMWNGTNYIGNITTGISGVLPVGNANVVGVAVAAATAHNIDLRVQTSTANAANIIRAIAAIIHEL